MSDSLVRELSEQDSKMIKQFLSYVKICLNSDINEFIRTNNCYTIKDKDEIEMLISRYTFTEIQSKELKIYKKFKKFVIKQDLGFSNFMITDANIESILLINNSKNMTHMKITKETVCIY